MFETGSPVIESDFINRKQELALLKNYLIDGQNVMLKAPRRFGKTSLIKECLLQTKLNAIYLDIKRAPNFSYLTERMLDNAYQIVGISNFFGRIKESIGRFLKQLKSTVSIKILEVIEIAIEKVETEKDPEELFLYALDNIEHLGFVSEKKL